MDMLLVLQGRHQGQRYPANVERLVMGRDRKADIRLDDDGISRRHAVVYRKSEKLWIEDLGSTNGTYVNNVRIASPFLLSNNDHIALGDTVLAVQIDREPTAQHVVVSDAPHTNESVIKLDPTSTSVFEVLYAQSGEKDSKTTEVQSFLRLYEFNMRVAGLLDLETLLEESLALMVRNCGARRGAILLLDNEGCLHPRATYVPDSLRDTVRVSRTLAEEVLNNREGILSAEAAKDDRFKHSQAISLAQITSMMAAPLLVKDRVIGIVYVDTTMGARRLDKADLHLLGAMSLALAVCVENARLYAMLRDNEEQSACVLKSIAGGLLVIDTDGRVERVNDGAVALAGVQADDMLGATLDEIAPLREIMIPVGQAFRTGKALDNEQLHIFPAEAERPLPVGVSVGVVEDYQGRTRGAVVHFRDLTRIRELSEQVERAERLGALGQLASGIAHEIRNPLNSVQGFVKLLRENARGEAARHCDIVLDEVHRIDGIVQDMLDFSRTQSFSMQPIVFADIAASVCESIQPLADENSVLIDMKPPSFRTLVDGNADRLKQVVLNISRNAIQASKQGSRVELAFEQCVDADGCGDCVCLHIRDFGDGIRDQDKSRIFDPFFTTRDKGTGLGLSICQSLIEHHGGRIAVESIPGSGSTFTIMLPRLHAQGGAANKEEEK